MVGRAALIVAALVIAGCLAFTLRATHLEADARALLTGPPDRLPAGTVDHADRILREAQRHNPDIRPEAGRGLLLASAGRDRAAAAVLREVVRKEPDNVRAAVALAIVLDRFDPAGAAEVRRHVRELSPPVR